MVTFFFFFFKGGLDGSNRYRIDPNLLVCCLNGSAPDAPTLDFLSKRRHYLQQKRESANLTAGALQRLEEKLQALESCIAKATTTVH